jgi:hypothetical protein
MASPTNSQLSAYDRISGTHTLQQHRVDVEEVGRQDTLGLADRNCRQVSPARRGAGSMPARLRSSHTVLGATVYPSPRSSP